MARKRGFKVRLKVAWNIVIGKLGKPMQIMVCEYCGSEKIKALGEWEDKKENVIQWGSLCKCQKCGAVCNEKQMWLKSEVKE